MSKFIITAMFLLGLFTSGRSTAQESSMPASSVSLKNLGKCSWSFFGDPRSLARGNMIITACVSGQGKAYVIRKNRLTKYFSRVRLFRFSEADDHDNPSLIFWHRRLCAFFSPHSGHQLPKDGKMFMDFRCSLQPYGLRGGFGRIHRVPLPKGGGLGYTYPNLVKSGNRLYLFMRGPYWEPYYTWSKDLHHWAKPRTLVKGPHKMRPYAKYEGGPDGSIHMVFSDAHPQSYNTSLRYMRMKGGKFYRANGKLIGTVRDLPFKTTRIDTIYHYSPDFGKAWPMDVALDVNGRPVVVYTLLRYGDRYWYARWDGHHWQKFAVATAGHSYGQYHNSGISLNHEDPSWVVFGHNDSGMPEIWLGHTPDNGSTWQLNPVTSGSQVANYRPIFPRGFDQAGKLVVEYVRGLAPTFWTYDTGVVQQELSIPGA
jgi:hypothetical protein